MRDRKDAGTREKGKKKVKKEREGRLGRAQMRSVGGKCDELLARRASCSNDRRTETDRGEADKQTAAIPGTEL